MKFDSTKDTVIHKNNVGSVINLIIDELLDRKLTHDNSKLESPEIEIFNLFDYNSKPTYGTKFYEEHLKKLKLALDHHYTINRHHPEHFNNGINDMNIIDIIEMFCDWFATSVTHKDVDIIAGIKYNKERFNLGDQLTNILINTAKYIKNKK